MIVTYSQAALKALRKIPAADAAALRVKLGHYAQTGEGDVKRLVGLQGRYRLRHGDWRAIVIGGPFLKLKTVFLW